MATDSKLRSLLPEAPEPRGEARDQAIASALARFDEKFSSSRKGTARDTRLMEQTATSTRPSHRRSAMSRARYAIAASLVFMFAGSIAWVYVNEAPLRWKAGQAAPEVAVTEQSSPTVARKVPTTEIAGAPRRKQAPWPASPTSPKAEFKLDSAVIPEPAARIASTDLERSLGQLQANQGKVLNPYADDLAYAPAPSEPAPSAEPVGRDQFEGAPENAFKLVREAPVSTFSIDVDTASYSFMRGSLARNVLPQPDAVRTEELINYFPYDYAAPASAEEPFKTSVAVFPSPWSEGRKLIRIGIKGYEIEHAVRPRANLVFLIDTSGSMDGPNRLPLVKQSLAMLVGELEPSDRVAIVTYAGEAGTALEPTPVSEKSKILGAIERLGAGGSTAGGEGIRQAYALAAQNFDAKSVNRVVLATDGDFNVGITDNGELKGFVERERAKGIFLSVLGFGMGNYNDALMQALAQNGNGTAAYIDTINEARKVLVEEATSSLFPIAKDVKIQVEFNPATIAEYRLIGYETRLLNPDDFNNDKVDAGEVGSGQSVTALYEIVPVGAPGVVGDLRYAQPSAPDAAAKPAASDEYAFVRIRYKLPDSDTSKLITTPVDRSAEFTRFEDAPADARFATGVAAFGEILRGGRHTGSFSFDDVLTVATPARGDDRFGYRSEFLQLVRAAKTASALPPLE
jgi:Ca-activated chloride channel family protein